MIKRWYIIMKPGLWMHNNDPIGGKQCRPKNRQRRNYWKTHIFCFANTFGFITVCNCVTYTFTIGHRNKTLYFPWPSLFNNFISIIPMHCRLRKLWRGSLPPSPTKASPSEVKSKISICPAFIFFKLLTFFSNRFGERFSYFYLYYQTSFPDTIVPPGKAFPRMRPGTFDSCLTLLMSM